VIGAEALIRWLHPKKGVISPLDFIPVAEQFGLITRLQDIVLRESCALINLLIENELVDDSFSVAINISGSQFSNPSLQQDLLDTIREYKLSPGRIKLEITESMLIDNIDLTVKQMIELKSSGFRFSIDDFGTGYSSLTYLQTFPIDELKIDKSFVDNIHTGEVGSGIVDAIIAMSRHLNFNVIAEGVEHKEQADILLTRNVKAMQGYYFARPMPADIFVDWLRQLQTL
jgi:EAL domain-containing protein (putative c-di-GMP-specific phosphodiesterase class I)